MLLQPGAHILNGKYRIERLLGEGASAEVYLVYQEELGDEQALKVLKREIGGKGSTEITKYRDRFRLEGRLQAQLRRNTRVLQVFGTETFDGLPVLVMEYAEGRSLEDELGELAKRETRMAWQRCAELLRDVAEGLQGLHARGWVHRDVKPSNILLERPLGRAKIGDLGLAQTEFLSSGRSDGQAGPHPGTAGYRSPEHEIASAMLPPAADIFALGVSGYRMLTGLWPPPAVAGRAAPEIDGDAPEWLKRLIQRMLAWDYHERPRNGGAVAEEIARGLVAERERAAQLAAQKVALRGQVEDALKAGRLIEADTRVEELLEMDPEDPAAQTMARRVNRAFVEEKQRGAVQETQTQAPERTRLRTQDEDRKSAAVEAAKKQRRVIENDKHRPAIVTSAAAESANRMKSEESELALPRTRDSSMRIRAGDMPTFTERVGDANPGQRSMETSGSDSPPVMSRVQKSGAEVDAATILATERDKLKIAIMKALESNSIVKAEKLLVKLTGLGPRDRKTINLQRRVGLAKAKQEEQEKKAVRLRARIRKAITAGDITGAEKMLQDLSRMTPGDRTTDALKVEVARAKRSRRGQMPTPSAGSVARKATDVEISAMSDELKRGLRREDWATVAAKAKAILEILPLDVDAQAALERITEEKNRQSHYRTEVVADARPNSDKGTSVGNPLTVGNAQTASGMPQLEKSQRVAPIVADPKTTNRKVTDPSETATVRKERGVPTEPPRASARQDTNSWASYLANERKDEERKAEESRKIVLAREELRVALGKSDWATAAIKARALLTLAPSDSEATDSIAVVTAEREKLEAAAKVGKIREAREQLQKALDERNPGTVRYAADQLLRLVPQDEEAMEAENTVRLWRETDQAAEQKRLADEAAQRKREEEERQRLAAIAAEQKRVADDAARQKREEEERQRAEAAVAATEAKRKSEANQSIRRVRADRLMLDLGNGLGTEFAQVPAGDFLYGESKEKRRTDAFWIGRGQVTTAQYLAFVRETGYERADAYFASKVAQQQLNHPAKRVSWDDAQAWCAWASAKANAEIRLPSEVEWEKAARGTDGREYPWGKAEPTNQHANFGKSDVYLKARGEDNWRFTTPVGQFSPVGDSPYGLMDAAGNVWEWCADWFDADRDYRVLRGGSFDDTARLARCAFRYRSDPSNHGDDLGFRVIVRPASFG